MKQRSIVGQMDVCGRSDAVDCDLSIGVLEGPLQGVNLAAIHVPSIDGGEAIAFGPPMLDGPGLAKLNGPTRSVTSAEFGLGATPAGGIDDLVPSCLGLYARLEVRQAVKATRAAKQRACSRPPD